MKQIKETAEKARQGETSPRHRVLKVLAVSTILAGIALFLGATFLV